MSGNIPCHSGKRSLSNINGSTSPEMHKTVKINSYLMATKNLAARKNGTMEDLPLEVMLHALKRLQNTRLWHGILDAVMEYAYHCLRRETSSANGNWNEADEDYSRFFAFGSPLALAYEVVRTWNLPLLFNNN
mmetsp:Transcript_14751/g.30899  ORF Transcript_14751/g.30899 Transcript_14751/m.30899 type:complete len:133 (-) Transcript_14751:55-453(-)